MPTSIPATAVGFSRRPSPSRIEGASWTITRRIAPTPTPKSSAARLGSKAEAPIQAPRIAGAPAIRPRPSRRTSPGRAAPSRAQRRDDRQALGGVVDREADDEEGAERERAGRVGGTDRQALAEVVEADPDRDQERQVGPRRRPCRRRPRAWARCAWSQRRSRPGPGRRSSAPTKTRLGRRTPRAPRRRSQALEPGVDREEGEQADGEGDQRPHPRVPRRRRKGSQSIPEADRDDADVDPEQRHQAEKPRSASGVSAATAIWASIVPPVEVRTRSVGLAFDPRIGDVEVVEPRRPISRLATSKGRRRR